MTKTVAILGASGSVGRQALDVVRARKYKLDFVAAGSDVKFIEEVAREFSPRFVALADMSAAEDLRLRLSDTSIIVLSGEEGICEGIHNSSSDVILNAILGKAGLVPTLSVIYSGKRLALANKESLVAAGEIVMSSARAKGVELLPVDSEHSAIFKALLSGRKEEISRIILTASGGPFFGKTSEELSRVTLADTLAHPTWKMGRKITVDSATLMNKGFELIEAVHLFDVRPEQVEVVIHRESILHSAVEYIDNSIIGELSVPDMRSAVQYALDYPVRTEGITKRLDLFSLGSISFARPDYDNFPLLSLAKRAVEEGGVSGAVLNAADEVAVSAFLSGRISFTDIARTVIATYDSLSHVGGTLEEIFRADTEARIRAREYIEKNIKI